jgi:hypothetical protein
MPFSFHDRMLAGGMLAALVLASAGCSRSDRSPEGNDAARSGAVTPADTQSSTTSGQTPPGDTTAMSRDTQRTSSSANTPSDTTASGGQVSGYQPMRRDTAATPKASAAPSSSAADTSPANTAGGNRAGNRSDTVAVGDSAQVGKTGERLEANQTSPAANSDSLANQPESDRVRPPEDSSETRGAVTSDSGVSGTMTRDTTADVGQVSADTAPVQAQVDTTTQQQDTIAQANGDTAAVQTQLDTTINQAQADTTTNQAEAEVAVGSQQDTAVVVGDSAEVGKPGERLEANAASGEANSDSLSADSVRIRPPEDSTEVLGNVNTADSVSADSVSTETEAAAHADGEHANAKAEVNSDVEAVGDAGAEAVGAARVESTGGTVTGEAAVSAVTREGQRCMVVDPETSPDVRWDVASSPATLNPCGTGTMTLPRVWTGEKR